MPGVLLVVPPFHDLFRPSLGVSLLKAALTQAGIPCDVLYLNLRFADYIGVEPYTDVADRSRVRALAGE